MAKELTSKDPVVQEIRDIRKKLAAKYDFDPYAMTRAARRRQRRSGHKVVSFSRRAARR